MPAARLRLGTRASPLARWQAEWVAGQLTQRGVAVELVPITTQGDVKAGPLGQIGGQGLFTKEIQRALLANEVDVAVHSCKDLPTEPVEGLAIAAVPERETTHDVLVCSLASSVTALPPAARLGTGSLRRKAQLLAVRPDLVIEDIRGNVESRLAKVANQEFDAIVLALAGLRRLGLERPQVHVIPQDIMLPAVGQGALAIEAREEDTVTRALLASLNHAPSQQAIIAERSLLAALRGGCLAPVGAFARIDADALLLDAVVLSHDGSQRLHASSASLPTQAQELGARVAAELLAQGAAQLIAAARQR